MVTSLCTEPYVTPMYDHKLDVRIIQDPRSTYIVDVVSSGLKL